MPPTVRFVTGTTSGIGAALVNHILSRGDRVIASGRNVGKKLSCLKSEPNVALLELDVAAGKSVINAQVKKAWEAFGHIDVLINNAGMSALKTAENAEYVLCKLSHASCPVKCQLLDKWQEVSSSTDAREFVLKPEYEKHIVVAGVEE
ncbi:hypothetical protein J3F83DRAFT_767402 [Trichoderma novae-zelandiae]